MDLGMHVDSCGILHAPVLGPLIYLGIYVELGEEGLDITLVLDGQKDNLEELSERHILVAVSLTWWIGSSSTD